MQNVASIDQYTLIRTTDSDKDPSSLLMQLYIQRL